MNKRKVYRERLLKKVEEKESQVDQPIEVRNVGGVTLFLSDEEKKQLSEEITQRMEDEKW